MTSPNGKRIGKARLSHIIAPLACAAMALLPVALSARPYLIAANGVSNDLSIIDLASRKVVAKYSTGEEGEADDVVATPDGRMLISNVQIAPDGKRHMVEGGHVVAIDTATGKRLWSTGMPGRPDHITVSADGSELYVPIFEQSFLLILDVRTGAVIGRMVGGPGMHGTRLSADGKHLYAGAIYAGAMFVFDLKTRELEATLPFSFGEFGGIGVRPFAVTRDDRTIYAQLNGLHGFVVFDRKSGKIVKTVRQGDLPKGFKYPYGNKYIVDHALELTPDGSRLVVASENTRKAYVYSTSDLRLLKTIPIGRVAKWCVITADGKTAYIANKGDSDVSEISLATLTETARFPTGGTGAARVKLADIPDGVLTARH